MFATAVAVIFITAGALSELAGLWLVVVGIARDRERARTLFARRKHPEPPRRSYPGRQFPSTPLASYGPPSGSQLRQDILRLEASAANALIGIRKAVDAELDRSVGALRDEMAKNDDELRDHLRYVLAGDVRGRFIGVILLAVGIALSVIGSLVGTLSAN